MSLVQSLVKTPTEIDWEAKWMNDPKCLFWAREYLDYHKLNGKMPVPLLGNYVTFDDTRGVSFSSNTNGGFFESRGLDWGPVSGYPSRFYAVRYDITILVWLKATNNITSTHIVVCNGAQGEAEEVNLMYEFAVTNLNELFLLWEKDAGVNVGAYCGDNTFLADGTYHFYHVKRIWNGSKFSVEFYRDLSLLNTIADLDGSTGGYKGFFAVGNFAYTSSTTNTNNFPGYIGQLMVYKGLMEDTEIKAFYNFTKDIYA